GMLVMAWWSEQLNYNAVQIVRGPDNRTFFQLADGTYNPPPGDSAQIIVYGQRAIINNSPTTAERNWTYDGMCVREVGHDGSTSYYGTFTSYTTPTCDSSGQNGSPAHGWGFRFRHQVFPQGVVVDFDDTTLSNNLGRSLSL